MKSIISIGLVILTGCASIIAPGPDVMTVSSEPPGATVFLDSCQVGVTPTILRVDRSMEGLLMLRKEGYQPAVWQISKPINGWFFGNILIPGGLIGIIIDAATGNIVKFSESPIRINMVKNN